MASILFYPRPDRTYPPIVPIRISDLVLDYIEDEGLIPQYKGTDGQWHESFYKGRTGHRAIVRFQIGKGLERFMKTVRENWRKV